MILTSVVDDDDDDSTLLCFSMCNIVLISFATDVSKLSSCLESRSIR